VRREVSSVLVVDDDHKNLKVVINHFEEDFYNVLYAPNGKEGIEVALEEQPDLILMDWAMPIMNGIDAVLRLKASNRTMDIPVVMTTGVMTTAEDLKEALEAGAVDFLRKPFDPLELTSRVEAALRLSVSYKEIKKQKLEIEKLMQSERNLMQKEIDHKERELALHAMHTNEKNLFFKDLVKRLQGLDSGEMSEGFKRIIKDVSSQLDTQNSWSTFLHHFENVHPNFFQTLNASFKGLTKNDLRFAAYVRIGMGNKEIAQLAGIETGTVKSNLHRLKKKLQLSSEQNLRRFLLDI